MKLYFGIYGYTITKPLTVESNISIVPRFIKHEDVKHLARDANKFHLTALMEYQIPGTIKENKFLLYDQEIPFYVSGILTFIEQQRVEITGPIAREDAISFDEALSQFPEELDLLIKRSGFGSIIIEDEFDAEPRQKLISLCIEKLREVEFNERTKLKEAFFRNVEECRMYPRFIDVSYYLIFSALELLSRRAANDYRSSIENILTPYLQNFGFDVKQNDPSDRIKSISTYCHLRNALFHNGLHEIDINENGTIVHLTLGEYYNKLAMLLPHVILRVLDYDDRHINWNYWYDRMPFQ